MRPAAIKTSTHTTGHGCAITSVLIKPLVNTTVFAGPMLMARIDDPSLPHPFPPKPPCAPHPAFVISGLKTVIVVKKPQARLNSVVDTKLGRMTSGYPRVLIGGKLASKTSKFGNAGGASMDDVGAGSKYA